MGACQFRGGLADCVVRAADSTLPIVCVAAGAALGAGNATHNAARSGRLRYM